MISQQAYERAEKRAQAKFGFYIHLIIYVAVISILVIINLTTSSDYFWVKWPMMGWGIAILIQALSVYAFRGASTIPAKMVEKELEKEEELV